MTRILRIRTRTLAVASVLVLHVALGVESRAQPAPVTRMSTDSAPGRGSAIDSIEVRARVVGIDAAARTLTLQGPKRERIDVVAGEEVRNFERIAVGDEVVVRYLRALSLELRPTRATAGAPVATDVSGRAAPGERPGAVEGRQIRAIAEVTAVDPKAGTITLKGPRGNSVALAVRNPEQFKVVKVGDQVDVTYTEAIAVAVEPAPQR